MINSPEPSANVNSSDQVRAMAERLTLEIDELHQMNAILRRSNQHLGLSLLATTCRNPRRGLPPMQSSWKKIWQGA